jgi:hypothetical protein
MNEWMNQVRQRMNGWTDKFGFLKMKDWIRFKETGYTQGTCRRPLDSRTYLSAMIPVSSSHLHDPQFTTPPPPLLPLL